MYTSSLSSRPQSAPPIIVVNDSDSQSPSPITSSAPSMIVPPTDTYDRSSTTTHVDSELVVGSRSTQAGQRRLRLVNNLHDIELDIDIDLPRIAVIGSQSSGKSSLIQAVSGIPLLKAPGEACTRCPIECRLSNGTSPWSCRVFLRRIAAGGPPSSPGHKEPFGDIILDPESLEDRILRAQLAILNPNTPTQDFLNAHVDWRRRGQNELSFSPNIICLEITGPDYSDISFVDLPGLIHNVGQSGNSSNIQLIEELAKGYISKENCIILVTITCETDFANQGAYELARRYDPQGKRTVGVLTKPDRSPASEIVQQRWVRFITGEDEQLDHGWFCVKLPDTQSGHPQPSFAGARHEESKWFEKMPPWQELDREAQNRLGTKRLVAQLEGILSSLIALVVPQIADQVEKLVESTTTKLRRLGNPPSADSVGEMYILIEQVVREIENGMAKQAREEGNVLYLIENEAVKFKQELRGTCPEFRAWNKGTKIDENDQKAIVPLPELLLEDGEPRPSAERREIIYLDSVLEKRARSSVRGLPDGGQRDVAEEYLRSFTANWNVPTNQFVKSAEDALRKFIWNTVTSRFEKFSHGDLPFNMCQAIEVHLQERLTKTREATALLLELEHNGHTRNDRLYRECKDQFLSHLKMQRELAGGKSTLLDLKRKSTPGDKKPHPSFTSSIDSAKAHLGKAGFTVEDATLARLTPPHVTDPALEDMAKASAGFEVALLRFVDYVPLAIDTVLVRGFCDDLANVLRQSFGLSKDNAAERCSYFLQEPPEIRGTRDQLRQKQVRLTRAAEELRRHGLWGA